MRKLASALSVLILTGCAALPTEIDIKSGPELIAQDAVELSYYTPTGPLQGATAQEIVSGFLAAGTGPQNDYAVARQYLTAEFAQRWNPESGVLIRSGAPVFKSAGNNLQVVELSVGATVDEQGRYEDVIVGTKTSLRFQLIEQDGEWRIGSAPNLTVVTPPVFAVVFNAFPVYFLDTNQSQLVPDLRWFPTRASTGTKLVNALLAGPSEWLVPGVSTAIPEGTKLTIDAVSVESGVALVDFDASALKADPIQRRLFLSQLRSTLLQLSGVSDVAVSVNGSAQDIVPSQLQTKTPGGLVFFSDVDGVHRVNATDGAALGGTAQFISANAIKDFAVYGAGESVAFVAESGVYVLETNGLGFKTQKVSDTTEIASLFFDNEGFLWIIPSKKEDSIQVNSVVGETRELTDELSGERIAAKISPEGVRLATLTGTEQSRNILVSTVVRDGQGWPIRLTQGFEIRPVLGDAIAITWQQNSTLRALERTTSGLTAVSDYPLSGPRIQQPMPPVVGVEIATGPSALSSYLLTDTGQIWVLTGTAWRLVSQGATALSTGG
ncbi:MAG: hypothetical protein RL068_586 [Actinomycetota bacterium]|jgi:hypothetical protein